MFPTRGRQDREDRPASDCQISEEEPPRDEGLLGGAGGFAHDVQVRRVEAQSGGRQAVGHEVDPQQLDGDQGLGQTQSSGQENAERDEVFLGGAGQEPTRE